MKDMRSRSPKNEQEMRNLASSARQWTLVWKPTDASQIHWVYISNATLPVQSNNTEHLEKQDRKEWIEA